MRTGSPCAASMLYLLFQKRKCKNCGKLSHKDVLFCWLCGCSFNHRICVAGHKNPPWVRHCLTCGKDRSLMSQPHTSKDLSFVRHPTRQDFSSRTPEGTRFVCAVGCLFGHRNPVLYGVNYRARNMNTSYSLTLSALLPGFVAYLTSE